MTSVDSDIRIIDIISNQDRDPATQRIIDEEVDNMLQEGDIQPGAHRQRERAAHRP